MTAETPRIIVTAGHDRARNALTIIELLRRRAAIPAGVLVVSPFTFGRVRRFARREGWKAILDAVPRALGLDERQDEQDAVDRLMRRHCIEHGSLRSWSDEHEVPYRRVTNVNDEEAVEWLDGKKVDWVIYGGGGILGSDFIQAAHGRILNPHSGPLPEVRGMNAAEWTILLGIEPTVTVHVIDEGIDTGGIVASRRVRLDGCTTIQELRSRHVAEGIELILDILDDPPAEVPPRRTDADTHRQCFVLSPPLRALVDRKLKALSG